MTQKEKTEMLTQIDEWTKDVQSYQIKPYEDETVMENRYRFESCPDYKQIKK